jgi:hypothetical protein
MDRKEILLLISKTREQIQYAQDAGDWITEMRLMGALLQQYETLFRELYNETFQSKTESEKLVS